MYSYIYTMHVDPFTAFRSLSYFIQSCFGVAVSPDNAATCTSVTTTTESKSSLLIEGQYIREFGSA